MYLSPVSFLLNLWQVYISTCVYFNPTKVEFSHNNSTSNDFDYYEVKVSTNEPPLKDIFPPMYTTLDQNDQAINIKAR